MNQNEKPISDDKHVEANRALLLERQQTGVGKYGVTLADAPLTPAQVAQHAIEEALDLANYLQRSKDPLRPTLMGTLMAWCTLHDVVPTFWDGEIRLGQINNHASRELILEARNYDAKVFDYTLYLHAWAPGVHPDRGHVMSPAELLALLNRLLPEVPR